MSKNFLHIRSITLIIFTLFYVNIAFAQDDATKIDESDIIYNQAEMIYGIDDRLINGEFYQNTKIITRGHPNFHTNKWSSGPLYIKGVAYDEVSIKYNIEIDKVILLAQFTSGNIMQLALNNSAIDSLYIDQHFLINAELLPYDLNGFIQPLHSGSFNSYLRHKKLFLNKTNENLSSHGRNLNTGSYRKMTSTLYLDMNGEFIKIGGKKTLAELFPGYEKEIIRYIKRNRISFRNINNSQLINLLKYCDEISSGQNK